MRKTCVANRRCKLALQVDQCNITLTEPPPEVVSMESRVPRSVCSLSSSHRWSRHHVTKWQRRPSTAVCQVAHRAQNTKYHEWHRRRILHQRQWNKNFPRESDAIASDDYAQLRGRRGRISRADGADGRRRRRHTKHVQHQQLRRARRWKRRRHRGQPTTSTTTRDRLRTPTCPSEATTKRKQT